MQHQSLSQSTRSQAGPCSNILCASIANRQQRHSRDVVLCIAGRIHNNAIQYNTNWGTETPPGTSLQAIWLMGDQAYTHLVMPYHEGRTLPSCSLVAPAEQHSGQGNATSCSLVAPAEQHSGQGNATSCSLVAPAEQHSGQGNATSCSLSYAFILVRDGPATLLRLSARTACLMHCAFVAKPLCHNKPNKIA
jgi:hypothetical protein